MADIKILEEALGSFLEGNMDNAKKTLKQYLSETKVEIIAQKLTEAEDDEDEVIGEIPTDDKVETLKDEIKAEIPADDEESEDELDLDIEDEEGLDGDLEATEEVIPVEDAKDALEDSGEEVGVEEDEDFLKLVDEYNAIIDAQSVEVPAEDLETSEEDEEIESEIADEEGTEEESEEDLEEVPADGEEIVSDEKIDTEVKPDGEEKQTKLDIEKFIK